MILNEFFDLFLCSLQTSCMKNNDDYYQQDKNNIIFSVFRNYLCHMIILNENRFLLTRPAAVLNNFVY